MDAVHIRRSAGAFAGASIALCLSIVSGQQQQRSRNEQVSKAIDARTTASRARVSAPAPAPSPPLEAATPSLVLSAVNGGDTEILVPQREDGGFSDEDLQRAAVVFSQQTQGKPHPVAPRLLDLVYRTMRHFDAKVVHVVSGFRRDRAGSRHSQGRAVDMRLEGVASKQLAEFVRGFGFVGVGYYPKSDFVHLDVRDASYFWIDDSAPDQPSRIKPVLEDEARAADAAARARGEVPDLFVPNNHREDRAAAKVYARRAQARREAARAHRAGRPDAND